MLDMTFREGESRIRKKGAACI